MNRDQLFAFNFESEIVSIFFQSFPFNDSGEMDCGGRLSTDGNRTCQRVPPAKTRPPPPPSAGGCISIDVRRPAAGKRAICPRSLRSVERWGESGEGRTAVWERKGVVVRKSL